MPYKYNPFTGKLDCIPSYAEIEEIIKEITAEDVGGSNGLVVKSGEIITDGGGIGSVVFGTAFPDTNYAISLSSNGSADDIIITWSGKIVNGFDVRTSDDGGKVKGNVMVNWIAIPYSNP